MLLKEEHYLRQQYFFIFSPAGRQIIFSFTSTITVRCTNVLLWEVFVEHSICKFIILYKLVAYAVVHLRVYNSLSIFNFGE